MCQDDGSRKGQLMSETECRHLPEPAWNPPRCPDCGALVRRPTAGPILREILDHMQGNLRWAGVAEYIIGEETARALMAEYADADRGQSAAAKGGAS